MFNHDIAGILNENGDLVSTNNGGGQFGSYGGSILDSTYLK